MKTPGTDYEGDLEGDKKDGYGRVEFANGEVYNGNLKDDERHGEGICEHTDGFFVGNWEDNRKHGKGTFYYSNGDVFNGEWKDDMKDGHGELRFANGLVHEGEWSNDISKSVAIHLFSNLNINQSAVPVSNSTAVRPASTISFVALQTRFASLRNSSGNRIDMEGHSLFESKDCTPEEKVLLTQIINKVDSELNTAQQSTSDILKRIDELSHQLRSGLDTLGASGDRADAQAAFVSEQQRKRSATLLADVQERRTHLLTVLRAAVSSAISSVKTSLPTTFISSPNVMTSSVLPPQSEKLDILIDLMNSMQSQITEGFKQLEKMSDIKDLMNSMLSQITEGFKQLLLMSNNQSRMLQKVEMDLNMMPLTFIIVPGIGIPKRLPANAPCADKIRNWWKRITKSATSLLWEESRIAFICPVTHKQVKCGLKDEGYEINAPTDLLKILAPVLKWGLIVTKIILTTQGLGSAIPEIDLLSRFKGDVMDAIRSELIADITKRALSALNYTEVEEKAANFEILQILAKEEGVTRESGSAPPGWKPTKTGLHLCMAPLGKGWSTWVSEEGKAQFLEHGEGAIKKFS